MIKNFSKCELNEAYNINGHELVITNVSQKTSGKCTHNLYEGTIDGEKFEPINSPTLKRMLGIDTLEYERDGNRVPKLGKEITEESINKAVDAIYSKCNKAINDLASLFKEETIEQIKTLVNDEIIAKADELRESLMLKMIEQQKAREAKENKAKEKEQAEALKERCAALGTTYSQMKKMADAMGVDVEIMITNMEGMRK